MKTRKNKKGFTIVELVIVIGVIGILSAILIPTFTSLTKSAQEAATRSDLAAAYSMYAADAADGYVGETKTTDLKFLSQGEVVLSKDASATDNKVSGYKFTGSPAAWTTEAKSIDVQDAYPATEDARYLVSSATYGGYYVYELKPAA